MYTNSLSVEDFMMQFGTDSLPDFCTELIRRRDFRWRWANPRERERTILRVLKVINSGKLSLTGEKERWAKGWGENLKAFEESGELSDLVPKYIRKRRPMRIDGEFAIPADPNFELNWYNVFRHWLFRQDWFSESDNIYEFGCGTGFNLAVLAHLYPDKTYCGADWVVESAKIVAKMGKQFGWNMVGIVFDFFDPDYNIPIVENSTVFSIGALEQTGPNYEKFFEYLLHYKPRVCVHVEPIIEWLSPYGLVDYTAICHLQERKYWSGFPKYMQKLQAEGKVEIVKMQRTGVGSLFIEGYNLFVFSPL